MIREAFMLHICDGGHSPGRKKMVMDGQVKERNRVDKNNGLHYHDDE